MHRSLYPSRQQTSCDWRTLWHLLAPTLFLLALVVPGAFAQTHVANPFAGATWYVNPDYSNEIATGIAQETDPVLVQKMQTVQTYPTAVWLDRIAAINGGSVNSGRLGLTGHLNAALQQQQQKGGGPMVVKIVIYDLPGRDCAALASNGELPLATGLPTYQSQYIDPIVAILSNPAYASLRIVAIIEPDSIPNLVTNAGGGVATIQACVDAKNSGVYVQGIQYAISHLHNIPNVYQYLDIGHSGWLGWPNNFNPAITTYAQLVNGTPATVHTIDGFVTDTANTLPTREPFMNASMTIGGQQLISANFYQFNPFIDEASYAQALYTGFVNTAGFPAGIGMIIDTSRNGWGGAARPTGPSTSTDVNTFVNATKIDRRAHRGLWCNPVGAGIGTPPQANPAGFFSQLQAFVWIKPPGESDGTYPGSANQDGALHADPNCDPSKTNPLAGNTPTGAYPNSPPAGSFFQVQFHDLVNNAFPPIPTNPNPAFSMTSTGTSIMQGNTGTSTITVNPINGFTGTVALSIGPLPTGVTATLSPTSITGGSGVSTLTFNVGATAAAGTSTVTITGTGGGLTTTTPVSLTVVLRPDFTLALAPTTVNVPLGGAGNTVITVGVIAGFSANVNMSLSGTLPAGVTAGFNPSATNGAGTSTLTFNAQPNATASTTTLTVTGTSASGGLSHSATLTLVVGNGGGGGNDFSLAVAPPSLTIAQGASGTSTITITRTGTFASAVSFSVGTLPTGVTSSFNPVTTTTTGTSSVLTLSASATATTGLSTVVITGTGGGLTHTVNLSLTITGTTPDFSLTPTPASLSVVQGTSGTSTISITRLNGFANAVSFSVGTLPAGVTSSFNPITTTTTGTSTVLTLSASATAALGTSNVIVTGTDGTLTRTATIALTVAPAGGSVTVTPVVTSSSGFFNEEQVRVANTTPLTALSVTINVQQTTGINFSGQYNTIGGQITQAHSTSGGVVTYTYTLGAGQTLGIGTNWTFAAQTSGTGTLHPTSGDTFTVTYTTGGTSTTQTGHF